MLLIFLIPHILYWLPPINQSTILPTTPLIESTPTSTTLTTYSDY